MKKMYVVMNVPSTGIFRRPKSNRLVDGDNRSIKVNTMPLYPSRIAAVSAAKSRSEYSRYLPFVMAVEIIEKTSRVKRTRHAISKKS